MSHRQTGKNVTQTKCHTDKMSQDKISPDKILQDFSFRSGHCFPFLPTFKHLSPIEVYFRARSMKMVLIKLE